MNAHSWERHSCRILSFFALGLLAAGVASAQVVETVKGTGMTTLSRPADHLHLDVQIKAHGKDVKEGITKLKGMEADAKKKLAAVQEGTIDFDPPRMESEDDPQKNYARMMANMANPGARKKMPAPQGVSVTTMLHCDWELKGADAGEIALSAYELQEKLKAASPWKAPAADNDLKAQEEEEAAEENAGANPFANMPKPGQPAFTFTTTFTADELTKAAGEAFDSARQQAAQLAKAAGRSLGDLRELEGQRNAAAAAADNPMAQYVAMMQSMAGQKTAAHVGSNVILGDQPGTITLQVVVNTTFQLKEK